MTCPLCSDHVRQPAAYAARLISSKWLVRKSALADAANYQIAENSARLRFVGSFPASEKLGGASKLHDYRKNAYGLL
jgi:hypothetical protein